MRFKILLAFLLLANLPLAFAQDPIVYSRCARTTDTIEISGNVTINGVSQAASRQMKGLDIYDVLPDVSNFFGDFTAPCDLVYRDGAGQEKILYNCSASSTDASACAALDPAVSFDGKTIAFSVFRGKLYQHRENVDFRVLEPTADAGNIGWTDLPNKKLKSNGAHLHTVDVATGALSVNPFEPGIYDSGPAFLANGRIAFTSNRDGNTSTVVWRTTASAQGTRIWTIDQNWRNLDLASHHSLSQEQHPYLLKNGRLAYSSWQILGAKPFKYTNGSTGGFDTLANLFHIYTQNPDGGSNFAFYGQHSGDHADSYFGVSHLAAHFITQTTDERVWFGDYYRGNNNGLGIVVGVMPEPEGQEGIAPEEAENLADVFAPRDAINFASWSTSNDSVSKSMPAPGVKHRDYENDLIFAGKVGHPAALTENGLMLAWGKGACSTVAANEIFVDLGLDVPPKTSGSGAGVAMNMMTHLDTNTPGCDVGLYRATAIPSQHPSDLEMIVDSPDWHELMARAVVPYNAIHGREKPTDIPSSELNNQNPLLAHGTPFGLLGAASITDRETHPKQGIKFAGEQQFNLQGTDTINYADEDLCGVRILSLLPNRDRNTSYHTSNLLGERVGILGEFPVINRDAAGNRVDDPSGNPDTSFLVRMPANAPYLMQGIDCNGRTLNTDMSWQSLRPGEEKVCGGCHVHSRPSRITFEQSYAATTHYTVPRLGEGKVPLLTGKNGNNVAQRTVTGNILQLDFARDIAPIFARRCTACHGGSTPEAELALDRPGDHDNNSQSPSTWWCLVGDDQQDCLSANKFFTGEGNNDTSFRRPQVSRYIRAFNSLGSLLYWKAANKRTDNNTDGSHADDLDFGADHPTTITAEELGLLSRWIDIGAPGGAKELLDTQKPTLHLTATRKSNLLFTLNIGTVDIGSGIAANSLIVCIIDSNNNCRNIAGPAEVSGITTVDLAEALSEPTVEVFASVNDLAGNITEVRRTLRFLASHAIAKDASQLANDKDLSKNVELIDPQQLIDQAPKGSTLKIPSGTYGQGLVINKSLTLDLSGVLLLGVVNSKAIVNIDCNDCTVQLENFHGDGNQAGCLFGNCAGVKVEGSNFDVSIKNSVINNTVMGILSDNRGGSLLIENTLIENTGLNDRSQTLAHGVYAGRIDNLIFRNSTVRAVFGNGHLIKSRAINTLIEQSNLLGLHGLQSRTIDFPCGGNLTVSSSTLQHGKNSDNADVISIGTEKRVCNGHVRPSRVKLSNNWIIIERTRSASERGRNRGKTRLFTWRAPIRGFIANDNNIIEKTGVWSLDTNGRLPELSLSNRVFLSRKQVGLATNELPLRLNQYMDSKK
ncbi:PD40 domain-containing protein [Thalassotalea sp. ND16A]|uniref:HzsA-related protein n=1 Tax=Thalassotalea sp. ND16A TaxID=1535422 RepID=UPI00051CDA51|nr:PD40 domain-containing protein [Thalassotalea sp. ND16A]KGJ95942.1 hypothetical protein ND16A_1121 [Thalassotalea sp. ND16A]